MVDKCCACCGQTKLAAEFSRRASAKDGLASYCKPCAKGYAAGWYRENGSRHRAKRAEFRAGHRTELAAEQRAYYRANRQERRAYGRQWAARNPDKVRDYALADAHRRRGAPLDAQAVAYVDVLRSDPCSYCGGPGGEMDHIVAVAAGGDSDWTNLTAACRSCNASKSTLPLIRL